MPSLTPSLETAIESALGLAAELKQEYATLEHLLFALIDDEDAAEVMDACKVDLQRLRLDLTRYMNEELSGLVVEDFQGRVQPTAGFQRVVQRAIQHVDISGRDEVTGANVLISIFSERESHAAYFLQEQDMTRYDAVSYISHGVAKKPGMSKSQPVRGASEENETPASASGPEALNAYCVNLNEKAKSGKVDPLIGRDLEIDRCIEV
ncbi:MAG: Clp protease N-terminal domain-containing protein, partial [Pseudomonadota bacterium]